MQTLSRPRCWLGLILATGVLLAQVAWFWHATIEDAYISFRYALHWAAGQGLVFNVGEAVEGYTNFSWTMLLGLAGRWGGDPVFASKILGLMATLGLLAVVGKGGWRLGGARSATLAVMLVAFSTPLAFWTVAGLETPLYALLIALSLYLFLFRGDGLYAWALAAAALTRPEALGFALILFGLDARRRGWLSARAALLFLLIFLPFLAWRWLTYGALTPNSLLAKAGLFEALRLEPGRFLMLSLTYAGGWVWKWGLVLWLPLAWAARREHVVLPLLLTLAYTAAVALAGAGDWMPLQRLWLPALTPYAWLAVMGWNKLSDRRRRLAGVLVMALVLLQLDLPALRDISGDTRHLDHWWTETMQTVATIAAEDELPIATTVLGRTGYYFSGPVLDAFGLTDRRIAQNGHPLLRLGRSDWDYVIAQRPAFLLINDPQLALRQRLVAGALYEWLPLSTPSDFALALFVRADRTKVAAQSFGVVPKPAADSAIDELFSQRQAERQRWALGPLYEPACVSSSTLCQPLWLLLKP